MKKIIFLLFLLPAGSVFSQDLTSKNGEPILPQAKDWAIGIDATKLIKDATFNFVSSSQAITGKYFKDAHTAYRVGLRIGINNWTTNERETDRLAATNTVVAYPAAVATKQNSWNRTATAFGLSFGVEKRRGTTRLQGIYGAEGGVYLSTLSDKFAYGNALNPNPSTPVTVDPADAMTSKQFGYANNIDSLAPIQGRQGPARIIERKNGVALSIGGRLFIGAEFFVLPKMSIGGEFGWGVAITTSGRTTTTYESIGASNIQGNTDRAVKRTTVDGGNSSSTRIDTDNAGILGGASASLRLNLYF